MDLKPPSVYSAQIQDWTLQNKSCVFPQWPTLKAGSKRPPVELCVVPHLNWLMWGHLSSWQAQQVMHRFLWCSSLSPALWLCKRHDCAEALDKANNFRQDKNRLGFYPTRIYLCEASKSSVVLTPLLCASLLFSGIRRGSNKLAQGRAFLQQCPGGEKRHELLEIHPKTFLWSSRVF